MTTPFQVLPFIRVERLGCPTLLKMSHWHAKMRQDDSMILPRWYYTRWYSMILTLWWPATTPSAPHRTARLRHETGQLRALFRQLRLVTRCFLTCVCNFKMSLLRTDSAPGNRMYNISSDLRSFCVNFHFPLEWLRQSSLSHWIELSLIYAPLWLIVDWHFYCKNCCCNNLALHSMLCWQ